MLNAKINGREVKSYSYEGRKLKSLSEKFSSYRVHRGNEIRQQSFHIIFSKLIIKRGCLSVFLLATVFIHVMRAQTIPPIEWQKSLGGSSYDQANAIEQTTDSGFVIAGLSWSNDNDVSGNHGSADYWIVKLDNSGNMEWQKSLGGNNFDVATSIQQTSDGGFIVAGYSSSNDGDVSGNHGFEDYWIVKLDTSGNIEWQKSLGGSGEDAATSIRQTASGGFIVAGYSSSNDGDVSGYHGGYRDLWIVNLDSLGNIEWQKSLGGSGYDGANALQQTTDGGFIVAGYSSSYDGDVSGNHGFEDYWIVKLNTSGNIEWQKSLGGSNNDIATSIEQTTDGGFVVAGYSYSNDGDVSLHHGTSTYSDYWIIKLDSFGNIGWQKSLGGTYDDVARSIEKTTDGGFIVAGYSTSNDDEVSGNHGFDDYWIVKLDSLGNIDKQKSLGGSADDDAWFTQQTTDGGFIIAGSSYSNDDDVTGNHGGSDFWVAKLDSSDSFLVFYADEDGDGYGNADFAITASVWSIPSGYVLDSTDCNDADFTIHPGAAEICNHVDDNCNGAIDEGLTYSTYFADNDGDNYGNPNIDSVACTQPLGYAYNHNDCNDSDITIHPGAAEICNNIDDNCNGAIDEGLIFTTYYADSDGDSYGDINNSVIACAPMSGYVTDSTDCDDNNAAINPSATEFCNGIDDNCNGSIDDGVIYITYYADIDGDSYGDINNSVSSCAPVSGYVTDSTDCDDNNAAINPAATEICNNLDDNCNGAIDDGLAFTTYYADVDGDTYGDANNSVSSCSEVSGYVTDSTDCDDNNAAINPSATEICNNLDDNCNGTIDDGLVFTTYYADADGDTYGDANNSVSSCASVSGYVTDSTDCDDNNAAINPSATEICNNLDDNCNGAIDDGLVFTTYYADADGDTYGDANNSVSACAEVTGYVTDSTDCDDNNAAVNPAATEVCDGIDNNCDGNIDEGLVFTTYYADNDGDNYGDANNSVSACAPVSGYVTDSTDCDDNNPNVNPGAPEIPNNGIDDNCNGEIDEFGVGISSINNEASVLSVFPNPTDGTFATYLKLSDEVNAEATLEALNLLGQKVYSQKTQIVKGVLQKEIQLSDAAAGMYLVKVIMNNHVYSVQINLQK